jgi:hypothetical protein
MGKGKDGKNGGGSWGGGKADKKEADNRIKQGDQKQDLIDKMKDKNK